jgi:hypothetical protein
MRFAIIDAAHLYNRAHHVCRGDAYTKAGMALHIVFNSLKKVYDEYKIDHMVVAAEGRSWRYDYYPKYKAKRILDRKTMSPAEQEEAAVLYEVGNDLMDFLSNQTKMTVLQSAGCEGDDFIARWIQLHPDDEHVIVSGDSDNIQLLASNVKIYDGLQDRTITHEGVFDGKGEPMVFRVDQSSGKLKVDKSIKDTETERHKAAAKELREAEKTERDADKVLASMQKKGERTELAEAALAQAQLEVLKKRKKLDEKFVFTIDDDWHKRALFIKIVRGDVGDGVFSAYPKVRYEGSKKVGIRECWEDRHEKGFHWNNFMLQKWEKLIVKEGQDEPEIVDVRVCDEFATNEMLIDLTKQPQEVKDLMDKVIVDAVQKQVTGQVGLNFLRFCKKHDLVRLMEQAHYHSVYMMAGYRS